MITKRKFTGHGQGKSLKTLFLLRKYLNISNTTEVTISFTFNTFAAD